MKNTGLINIESLIKMNKTHQNPIFPEILKKCHSQINRYSTQHKATECIFIVPAHVFGKPLYNIDDLLDYLVKELKNNGLYVQQRDSNLYISWATDNLDYNNYVITRDAHQKDASNTVTNMVYNIEKFNRAQRVQQERDKYFKSLCSSNIH